MLLKALGALIFCFVVALIICQRGFAGTEAATASPVGAWQFVLTPSASSTPHMPIVGLISFTSDGTVAENDLNEIVSQQPTVASTPSTGGQGIWQPSPVFGKIFIRYMNLIGNPNATLRARRITTLTVSLNSTNDQFRGGYNFDIVDPTGRVVISGSGTVKGALIPHPLLP